MAWVPQPWAAGYSGWPGVTSSGSQFGSGTVAGLPSVSASWIAVYARQKAKWYFAFRQAVMASEKMTELMAASRAESAVSRCWVLIRLRNARLYWAEGLSDQNFPISVCSAVRSVLLRGPSALVRLKSRAQAALANANGGRTSARN